MVTHHVDHIMAADEVWYLEAGRLLEAGPPAALLSNDGPVARFFGISKPVAI